MRDALAIFLKAPRPGQVKTRLIPALGASTACALYRALAETVVARTAPRAGAEYDRLLFFAPADAGGEIGEWFPGETRVPQEGDDLGRRMAAAFDHVFDDGARRVVLIGTDAPWLDAAAVVDALQALETHDVVLGPAEDGGYYLVGLREPQPRLFEGIRWSTACVLAETLARAASAGLRVRTLAVLPDIDVFDDVRREWPRLRPLIADRAALIAAVDAALGV